jgi:hypothetical protein
MLVHLVPCEDIPLIHPDDDTIVKVKVPSRQQEIPAIPMSPDILPRFERLEEVIMPALQIPVRYSSFVNEEIITPKGREEFLLLEIPQGMRTTRTLGQAICVIPVIDLHYPQIIRPSPDPILAVIDCNRSSALASALQAAGVHDRPCTEDISYPTFAWEPEPIDRMNASAVHQNVQTIGIGPVPAAERTAVLFRAELQPGMSQRVSRFAHGKQHLRTQ